MATTTIRVDERTHAELKALAAARTESLMDTVRAATEALRRQRYADEVARQLDELRADPQRWADYLADLESTEVVDGLGR